MFGQWSKLSANSSVDIDDQGKLRRVILDLQGVWRGHHGRILENVSHPRSPLQGGVYWFPEDVGGSASRFGVERFTIIHVT